jgi:hypothetical protein
MIRETLLIACAILSVSLSAPAAASQAPADSLAGPGQARLEILTDIDSALVYLDTLYAGRTPLVLDSLPAGTYLTRIIPPHEQSWLEHAITDTLVLSSGQRLSRRYELREYLAVRSDPPGAQVFLGDSLAGETPLLLRIALLHPDGRLMLRKDGYEPFTLATDGIKGSIVQSTLKAGWQHPPLEESPFLTAKSGWSPRRMSLYLSGGAAVLAGIASAYFKISADDRQDAYLMSGNPALLSERQRLDRWAGVTFAITQVGLAIFSYLLISE